MEEKQKKLLIITAILAGYVAFVLGYLAGYISPYITPYLGTYGAQVVNFSVDFIALAPVGWFFAYHYMKSRR